LAIQALLAGEIKAAPGFQILDTFAQKVALLVQFQSFFAIFQDTLKYLSQAEMALRGHLLALLRTTEQIPNSLLQLFG
ncbi:hypothetical protein, partial [Klebsiella pneumoniae]|uniref:hypothetical protein n=1 Tax=Klebsiella pneumoniae TaxID=573 RepID=UPI0027308D35